MPSLDCDASERRYRIVRLGQQTGFGVLLLFRRQVFSSDSRAVPTPHSPSINSRLILFAPRCQLSLLLALISWLFGYTLHRIFNKYSHYFWNNETVNYFKANYSRKSVWIEINKVGKKYIYKSSRITIKNMILYPLLLTRLVLERL